ncbi:MAG: sulfatase [Candidatus Krumholzibacteriia bacterium]
MIRDPFRGLVWKQRWRGRLERSRRWLLDPAGSGRPARHSGPPHLLLMGVDTLRYDHLGLAGYRRATSPHLDALAALGTCFDDVMAPAPWTLPSFSSALTGLTPSLHGALLDGTVRNMSTQPPHRLPEDVTTLAQHLATLGYRTAAIYSNQFFGFGLAESFQEHAYHNLPADDLVALILDWLRRNGDRPCFVFTLFNDPHEPTTPPPDLLGRFWQPAGDGLDAPFAGLAWWGEDQRGRGPAHLGRARPPLSDVQRSLLRAKLAVYDAAVATVDRALGRLWRQLERWNLQERTLVSVFADHGEEFLDHLEESLHWRHDPRPWHGIGHGHTHFQELLHVPWLAVGPGVPAGVRHRAPVSLCDLAPTLVDWLGVAPLPLPQQQVDGLVGRSLTREAAALPRAAAAARPEPALGTATAVGPERTLLSEAIAFGPDLVAVRRGRWKLVAQRGGKPLGLFDLDTDPGEKTDRAAAEPVVAASLLEHLALWREAAAVQTRGAGGSWRDLSDEVRQRLRDLGYGE